MKQWIRSIPLIASVFIGGPILLSACAGTEEDRSTGEYVDDAAISSKVKTNLLRDPEVSGFAVEVETNQGIVQLSGFVDDNQSKAKAEDLARQVEGVKQVKNDIIVKK